MKGSWAQQELALNFGFLLGILMCEVMDWNCFFISATSLGSRHSSQWRGIGDLAHTTKRCKFKLTKEIVAAAAKLVVVVVETQLTVSRLFGTAILLSRCSHPQDLSSDESLDLDSPKKTRFAICRKTIPETEEQILSARIDNAPESTKKQGGFRAAISPWKLIKMSRQKAQLGAESGPSNICRFG
ncbi:hypothetical protein Tco_0179388 [Tanacetum coccineum]